MAQVMRDTCVCVFAKPPRAGEAKTRLIPALGAEGAARLAHAFLLDTWALVESLPWARPVLTSPTPWPDGLAPAPQDVWHQGEGDLGARVEGVLHRALAQARYAFALGADSPGLPAAHLEGARAALHEGADAVFGPADDGGFYLLAVRRLPQGALEDLPWSAPDTLAACEARLVGLGLCVVRIAPWFDVDTPAELDRVRCSLGAGHLVAPHTLRALTSSPSGVPSR